MSEEFNPAFEDAFPLMPRALSVMLFTPLFRLDL